LRRNILSKLERAMPDVRIRLATASQSLVGSASDKWYGDVEYVYGARSDSSRSTSHREILPLLYALAGVSPPAPAAGEDYPGYPLVANAHAVLPWFLGVLPPLILLAWWWSTRPPRSRFQQTENGGRP
jgi:ABC-2 type transport system permease protein